MRSPKTVFSNKDVALIWGVEAENAVRVRLNSYVRSGKLIRVHRGIYAKDKNYNRFELATRIYTPSYISFETILTRTGINFQYYGNIFVATYVTREIVTDGQKISFVHMKDYVLSNTAGIEHADGIAKATKERAFLDRIYISKDYHFDNLDLLDWDKVFEILPIYHNKRMEKKVLKYYKETENGTLVKQHLSDKIKEDMFAHKLMVMHERVGKTSRDIYDVWFFLEKNWPINKKIIEDRMGVPYAEFLKMCIDVMEKFDDSNILLGMGELLLTEKQKAWVKAKLKSEALFSLRLALEKEK